MLIQSGDVRVTTPRSLLPPTIPQNQYTTAEILKKSIKRNASLFSKFKGGNFWDSWRRIALANTNTQKIADVLDPDYSTTSPEDIVLFQKKQKFMRSVFDKVLHKDRGKN